MKAKPFEQTVAVSSLLLDTQNPRLPEIQESQHETLRSMIQSQGEKIYYLAKHIVENGLNPASLLIVTPSTTSEGMYLVLDGNRRVAALKLLESPTLAEGLINSTALQKIKDLSIQFQNNPVLSARCVILPDRSNSDTWIVLLHRGQQQGAGLVEWDGQVAARYDVRNSAKNNVALEILDFVRQNGALSDETTQRIDEGKFPITSLERLVNTRYVRKKVGIELTKDRKVNILYPTSEVLKGLSRVVDDLGTGKVTVSQIKSQEQRIEYVNRLSEADIPQAEKWLPSSQPLVNAIESKDDSQSGGKSPKKTKVPNLQSRPTLIPNGCKLNVTQPRVNRIYHELKRLIIDDFPNCGAVMFRVFLELSLDHYLEIIIRWPHQQIEKSSLAHKLNAVRNHFENNAVMTKSQLEIIERAASGQTQLSASIKTLHGFVHNKHFTPIASELKTAWDDFQPFVEQLWQN